MTVNGNFIDYRKSLNWTGSICLTTSLYSDEELKKYRYLFCTKSKVASHYQAMADILELDGDDIEAECPDFIKRLIEKCSVLLRGTEDE